MKTTRFEKTLLFLFVLIQLIIATWRASRLMHWGFTEQIFNFISIETFIGILIPSIFTAAVVDRNSDATCIRLEYIFYALIAIIGLIGAALTIPVSIEQTADRSVYVLKAALGICSPMVLSSIAYTMTASPGKEGIRTIVIKLLIFLIFFIGGMIIAIKVENDLIRLISAECAVTSAVGIIIKGKEFLFDSKEHYMFVFLTVAVLIWTLGVGTIVGDSTYNTKLITWEDEPYMVVFTDKDRYYCVAVNAKMELDLNRKLILGVEGTLVKTTENDVESYFEKLMEQ